jgi:hypothetical protein
MRGVGLLSPKRTLQDALLLFEVPKNRRQGPATSGACAPRAALCEWAVAWGTVSFACGARLFNLDQESS